MNTAGNARKRESRQRIEQAFLQLVQQGSVSDITVSQLCALAQVNRTTFYANYDSIGDLNARVRDSMVEKYAALFPPEHRGLTKENFLMLFRNIKENQVFYRTFFKLGYDETYAIVTYNKEVAQKRFGDRLTDYHTEFFRAGISALIKKWLAGGCSESPEEIGQVLFDEYASAMKPE